MGNEHVEDYMSWAALEECRGCSLDIRGNLWEYGSGVAPVNTTSIFYARHRCLARYPS
ncbi:hypothetical protein JCM16307_01030 [Thermococcus prieurii]